MKNTFKLNLLLAIFIGLLIAMNTLGIKIISLFGVPVTVGIFLMPITFLITDMVAEVYGKRLVRQFVGLGLIVLLIYFVCSVVFITLEPHERFLIDDSYGEVFGSTLRMMIASIIAFAISQYHDIWAFEYWKKKTNGKMLWLRNNMSTLFSQAIDTLVFMFIAFYQLTPQFTAGFIIELVIPFYLFKIAFAVIDTPFVYVGVRWLKKSSLKE